jgi:hypothetical protein
MEFKIKLINCGIKNLFIEALKLFSIYSGDGDYTLNFVEK